MGLFSNFVERRMAAKLDKVAAKMEQAGAQAVSIAKDLVPVRTGQLQASVSYQFNKQKMELTIICDKFYGVFVDRGTRKMAARPFLTPAVQYVRKQFGLDNVSGQFSTTPAQYQAGYQRQIAGSGFKRVIVGNRPMRRG
jgi:HK97 gp10 family phage protein